MSHIYTYIEPEQLSGVVISHSHPDHYNDLPALRHYWRSCRWLGQDLPPLPVWFPPLDNEAERWEQIPEFEVRVASASIDIGDLKLEFIPGKHALPVSMVKVSQGNKSLFYTADTALLATGVKASQGCSLLIAECTLPPEEAQLASELGHLTWEECGRWGAEANCDCLLATHFWPRDNLNEIAAAVAKEYHGKLIMAKPGLKLEV